MNNCVSCGNYVSEGDMICPLCKQKLTEFTPYPYYGATNQTNKTREKETHKRAEPKHLFK